MFSSVDDVIQQLSDQEYICDKQIATVVFLAQQLDKPVLVEGPAGVGKTELAKVVSGALGREMIRLQCYEGLDEAKALYEWEYSKQLLYTQILKDKVSETIADAGNLTEAADRVGAEDSVFFSNRFIVPRPLMQAISADEPVLLLIDEVDKSDPEFEAFLLEILSDYSVTVPELGTFSAADAPVVVITSNRTRDVHDALKRRCLYHWVEHPDFEREVEIIRVRAPEVDARLARQVAAAVEEFRGFGLYKPPGVAETIDWAQALARLGADGLDSVTAEASLGTVLKYREDQERVRQQGIDEVVAKAATRAD